MEQFDALLSGIIDSTLGLRKRLVVTNTVKYSVLLWAIFLSSQTQDMQSWYNSTCHKRADYLQHNLHITVYLLMTALIRNFYRTIIKRINVKDFGLSHTSRIKTFVFKYISVPAKWIKTSRAYRLNIYTDNLAYARAFKVGSD